jgi:hypothetical protein
MQEMMREAVYHFTDTRALPWIISSGELKLAAKRDYTPTPLLWATTSDKGEETASCGVADEELECVSVSFLLVRFKLAEDDFFEWSEITSRCPGWTAEHVAELEDRARDYDDYELGFSHWRWRAAPLPLSRVLQIDVRSYEYGQAWEPLRQPVTVIDDQSSTLIKGVVIGDYVYFAEQFPREGREFTQYKRAWRVPARDCPRAKPRCTG